MGLECLHDTIWNQSMCLLCPKISYSIQKLTTQQSLLSPIKYTVFLSVCVCMRVWMRKWKGWIWSKRYKWLLYFSRENGCDKDEECGFNEYCTTLLSGIVGGQCRTKLSDGSLCVRLVTHLRCVRTVIHDARGNWKLGYFLIFMKRHFITFPGKFYARLTAHFKVTPKLESLDIP